MALEDRFHSIIKYYYALPPSLRELSSFIYNRFPLSIRYGKKYSYYKNLLEESQYWDDKRKNKYTLEKIKDVLINAYENTDYYRNIFSDNSFNPYEFKNLNQLLSLPYTDKNIIKENVKNIINKNISKNKLLYTTTGGTSGVPLGLYLIKGVERSRELAFINHMWRRVGYRYGDRMARIRGTVINFKDDDTIFIKDSIKNRLIISTYDLHDENFPKLYRALKKFKPKFIHAYPSSAIILGKYLTKHNLKLDSVKGLLCGSEQIYSGQREFIERAFNSRVYSWYGHSEATTIAGECENNHNYHLAFEYGFTELIDKNGNVISKPNIQGEIVGTSFEMKGFPLIRYKTGDYAEYTGKECDCGRNYKLIRNLTGRRQKEQILTKKDSLISITALNMHTNIFDNVRQYQFHQFKKGAVTLKIIQDKKFSDLDEKNIKYELGQKFRSLVDLNISYVKKLETTKNGKFKYLLQELELILD
jgi:phenylacetate-CoA ligase